MRWVGDSILCDLDKWRRHRGEAHRQRKLGTVETVWLMFCVAVDNRRRNLHEILRLATDEMAGDYRITVSAFCQARARFSP